MKIYILTCVNEDAEIVSIDLYKTHALAQASMAEQYYDERSDFEGRGFDLDSEHDYLTDNTASTGTETLYYNWNIYEREL